MKDEAYFLKRFERVEELGQQVLSSVRVGFSGHRNKRVGPFCICFTV